MPGSPTQQLADARSLAFDALVATATRGAPPAPDPTPDALRAMIEFLVGAATDEWFAVLREELALSGADHRAPGWSKEQVAPDVPWRVAVIGAGMSGLLAAHRLRQAGVDVTVLEKDDDVGGTWSRTPTRAAGSTCPNHFYSYSFAQSSEWPQFFSTQPALLDYFRQLRRRARPAAAHPLRHRGRRGPLRRRRASAGTVTHPRRRRHRGHRATFEMVVSAVGQLNRPKLPDIPGIEALRRPVVPLGAVGPRRRPRPASGWR